MRIEVLRPEKDYVPPTQQKVNSLTISAVFSDIEVGTPRWFNSAHEAIEHNQKLTDEAKLILGEQLRKKKKEIGHGKFEQWVRDNLKFTIKTAQRYMYPEDKNDTMSFLPPPPESASDKGSEDSVNEVSDPRQNDTIECTVTTEKESKEEKTKKIASLAKTKPAISEDDEFRFSVRLHRDYEAPLKALAKSYGVSHTKYVEGLIMDHLYATQSE